MKVKFFLTFLLLCLCFVPSDARRETYLLNSDWSFRFSHQTSRGLSIKSIPHTWNAQDALSGKPDYKRGIGNYEKDLFIDQSLEGKRLFLRFDGANTVTNVFINGIHVGEHRGGYAAFVFEITDFVNYGKNNKLLVKVNNGEQLSVMPLVGDFIMYGGLYRDVSLVVTEQACVSPLDYASPGVYLVQDEVSENSASVNAVIALSNRQVGRKVRLVVSVNDGQGEILVKEQTLKLSENEDSKTSIPFTITAPRLWNGVEDPFLYSVDVSLWEGETLLDKVTQPLGLRYFSVDPEKGFFLNGKHLVLHGVSRHQDRPEIGNALRKEHFEEDVALMREMGVNVIRLSHYQQGQAMYNLLDRAGIVTWTEIPFVGPGGFMDDGYVNQESFKNNGKQQLIELIRQNYNHPCVCFWGMFNEIRPVGDDPVPYITELNDLAHSEDPTRLTTSATCEEGDLNYVTDCTGWNKYFGWYGKSIDQLAVYIDNLHKEHPQTCIAISEYGAGASIYHQQDSLVQPNPRSFWHPENWQTYYHIESWKIIHEREFIWGSFVWNMFDFGAAHRQEGDRPGINDKGLVTFDRKTKKDAFYFYKANWNPQPMLYLCGKRHGVRTAATQDFVAFTNAGDVELLVNGRSMGVVTPDNYAVAKWEGVTLPKGTNTVQVRSLATDLTDQVTILQE